MSQEKNHFSISSIPLPATLRDALINVPDDMSFVSHSVVSGGQKSGEAPDSKVLKRFDFLTTDNHAFYIGKYIPPTFGQRAATALGWSSSKEERQKGENSEASATSSTAERIYSEELIEASLQYLFSTLRPGEKATYIIGRFLSEMVNGREDVANALTIEEEIKLVKQICKKKFPSKADRLIVVALEDMPEHQALFEHLQEAYDSESGRSDVDFVLMQAPEDLRPGTNEFSLQIARHLYRAVSQNNMLAMRFRATVPARLKQDSDNEQVRRAQNYGIIEVATRLADLYNGRAIQGGAERQAVYDNIIAHILQGPNGKFRSVRGLQELLTLFEGKRFETLHLDSKHNPPLLRGIRDRARMRIAAMGMALAATATGVYKSGEIHEQRRSAALQASIDKSLAQELSGTTFRLDYKWELDKSGNVRNFHHISQGIMLQIQDRYGIAENQVEGFRPMVEEYLLSQKRNISTMNEEVPLRIDAADEFIRQKRFYLMSRGVEVREPFSHLTPYLHLFDQAEMEDFRVSNLAGVGQGDTHYNTINSHLRSIGFFRTGSGYDSNSLYELAIYTDEDNKPHLVESLDKPNSLNFYTAQLDGQKSVIFSSQTARRMACHYQKEMRYYEAGKFNQYSSLFYSVGTDTPEFVVEEGSLSSVIGTYRVFPHGLEFELAIYKRFMGRGMAFEEYLVARRPGEKSFSTVTGKEAAWHWMQARSRRWENDRKCDSL